MSSDEPTERELLEQRLELLEALERAVARRDEVMTVLGGASMVEDAARSLQSLLEVDEIPAQAVLDLQLRWFVASEADALRAQVADLRAELARLP